IMISNGGPWGRSNRNLWGRSLLRGGLPRRLPTFRPGVCLGVARHAGRIVSARTIRARKANLAFSGPFRQARDPPAFTWIRQDDVGSMRASTEGIPLATIMQLSISYYNS